METLYKELMEKFPEDAVHEVMADYLERVAQGELIEEPQKWLHTACLHATMRLKQRRNLLPLMPIVDATQDPLTRAAARQAIEGVHPDLAREELGQPTVCTTKRTLHNYRVKERKKWRKQ